MVLHLEEFQQKNLQLGKFLNYYDKLPGYLHEMSVEDIMKHINRNGVRSWYLQQRAVLEYFMWLHKNYGIDLVEKFFELQQVRNDKAYVGFYTLDELKQGIEAGIIKAESENGAALPDYSGLKAIFFLEWYGVLPEAAITIKLTDVSDDGKKIYIPAENRTIEIDDNGVSSYFVEYKNKKGFKRPRAKEETPYTQNTFYRNTARRGGEVTVKTIYNIRQKFLQACEDERFEKRRVFYAGRYVEMIKAENKLGRELSASDTESCEIIQKLFNDEMTFNTLSYTVREYKVFKEGYIDRI